jgi:predicted outer membrane repeat protein
LSLSNWLSWPRSPIRTRRGRRSNPESRPKKARLFLEWLDHRVLPANYVAASVSALITDMNSANTSGGANTITLTAATTAPYVLTGTMPTGNGLPVIASGDNLTIVGSGDTIERSTAASTQSFRLIDVAAGGSLTLDNLTLQGGLASRMEPGQDGVPWPLWSEGGAIYNQGALTLSGVTVEDNSAVVAGGGIYSSMGSVTLEGGSIVQENSAGGVVQSTFTSGSAGLGGGLSVNGGTLTVTNAAVDNNDCVGTIGIGGLDYGGDGGGLYADGCKVTMTNATLNNNSTGPLLHGGDGGGLYALGCAVTMTNDTLDNNSSSSITGLGGGLWLTLGAHLGGATLATLTNCTVESNSAGQGGGLYVGGDGTVTLADDTVESNSAGSYGGGLCAIGATVNLTSDTVEFNQAGEGGGLLIWTGIGAVIHLDSFTVANTINNKDLSGLNGSTANIAYRDYY